MPRLTTLIRVANEALEQDPADGGRPPDWRFRGILYELGRLYRECTGREPGLSRNPHTNKPSGPFFRLVSTCLQMFRPELAKSDEALATAIRRVRKIKVRPTL